MTVSPPNPFGLSEQYWKVTFALPQAAAAGAEGSFGDMALAVSAFEIDEKNHLWNFELLCGMAPDMDEINRRLLVLSSLHGAEAPRAQLAKLDAQDWLAKVACDFPPIDVGRFYVYGAHVPPPLATGTVPIKIDAGAAFGSGEHGTTYGCLEALDWLAKRRDFTSILDMGCGSGILAIAAAKLWKADTLAVDIDPVAVRVAAENVRKNQAQAHVAAAVSDGYGSERVKRAAPFDLIISNILARPLVAFAPDLKRHLSGNGVAVLSGLLVTQETQVRWAHGMQGLTLVRRIVYDNWCTLVMER